MTLPDDLAAKGWVIRPAEPNSDAILVRGARRAGDGYCGRETGLFMLKQPKKPANMTPRTVIEPRPIWQALKHLRAALIDADWNGDDTTTIRAAIARLEMLQSYGETHDVDH